MVGWSACGGGGTQFSPLRSKGKLEVSSTTACGKINNPKEPRVSLVNTLGWAQGFNVGN
jgi:hypothetical protein